LFIFLLIHLSIVPYKAFDPDSYGVISYIFDKLVVFDFDGSTMSMLATSWKRIDPLTVEFRLREGVKFHNGDELTAEDVKFTIEEVHLNPKIKSPTSGILASIKEVQVIDKYTFRVITHFPDGMLIYRFHMFSDILPSNLIKKIGYEEFEKKPIGAGPFKFVSYEKGKRIILEKNEDYWNKDWPKYDKLIFEILPASDWVNALVEGKVDAIFNLKPKDAQKIEQHPDLKVMRKLVHIGYQIILSNKGVLKDKELRKALNYAINRKILIQNVEDGFGRIIPSLGKFGELGSAAEELKPYPYDPEKAKQILKQKGYTENNPLRLKALVSDISEPIYNEIKKQLQQVGVILDGEIVSRPDWAMKIPIAKMTKGKPDYDGDMAISMVDNPIKDAAFHYFIFLHSQGPFSLMSDPEYDKKLEQAVATTEEKEHERKLKEIDKMIHENAYMIFTYQKELIIGMKKNVLIKGIVDNGHLTRVLSDAEIQEE
jgi:peptide/nickel transport system substrate-binding protein